MPSFPCANPVCTEYVKMRGGLCPEHQGDAAPITSASSFYDQHLRDPEAARFYHSSSWKRARGIKLRTNPCCEYPGCNQFAKHVHHKIPLRECTPQEKLDQRNLYSVCVPHHNHIENQMRQAYREG